MFLRVLLTIWQHWFRWWLGAEQVTSHYLNQCWYVLLTHVRVTRPQWVNLIGQGYDKSSWFIPLNPICYSATKITSCNDKISGEIPVERCHSTICYIQLYTIVGHSISHCVQLGSLQVGEVERGGYCSIHITYYLRACVLDVIRDRANIQCWKMMWNAYVDIIGNKQPRLNLRNCQSRNLSSYSGFQLRRFRMGSDLTE